MRAYLAISFCLLCRAALADGNGDIHFSVTVPIGKPESVSADSRPYPVGPSHVCASYPREALRVFAQGMTTMSFTVTAQGNVSNIRIEKSSGNNDLDAASIKCASKWRYKPAMKDGVAIDIPWVANAAWKIPFGPEMQEAMSCLYLRQDNSSPPSDLGHTVVNFRVLQDGSVVDAKVVQSSGYNVWDDMGRECTSGRHFEVSEFTLPSDGLPGHWDINWLGAIALDSNNTAQSQDNGSKND